jgi:D-alanine-D-alanine ligase
MKRKLHILVLAGGPSSEYDVSLKTAALVVRHLDRKKYDFEMALIGKDEKWKFDSLKKEDRVMIQKYMIGREFTCGVFVGPDGKAFALPPTEIIPKEAAFSDYRSKYTIGGSLEVTPARLPKAQAKELQKLAIAAHRILNCRGVSRSDFILKGSKFYILETNTIPGMTETSLLPQGAKAAGIEFPALLDLMIGASLKK